MIINDNSELHRPIRTPGFTEEIETPTVGT